MRTLDEAWMQFCNNAKASARVSKSGAYLDTSVRAQLVANLAVVEATLIHIRRVDDKGFHPAAIDALIKCLRTSIRGVDGHSPSELAMAIDLVFDWVVGLQAKLSSSTLTTDAISALGWLGKAQLFLLADAKEQANDAGRNTMDAVTRVVILTGHSRESLSILMRELVG
jgi:hypothetical protein